MSEKAILDGLWRWERRADGSGGFLVEVTFDDLIQILEGLGAKRYEWPHGITNDFNVEPGPHLVLPLRVWF